MKTDPTPLTDGIWKTLAITRHPETDSEHFHAAQQAARNGIEDLEQRLAEAKDRARQAEAEITTLANGDRLHTDASENALIVQTYIAKLKRQILMLKMTNEGVTEQDIAETMPPPP